jgi:hypothetical protein
MTKPRLLRLSYVAALLAASVISSAHAAQPEVLTQIPADAYGVIVVNNPRTLANKVSNAAARLQLPIPPDLVGAATRSMGIDEGFDVNSSAALVFLKPPPDREGVSYFNGMPPAVILLPTTNSKAMLENYKATEPDKDGISQVTLPQNPEGEKGFVTVVDKKWVAFAQKRDDLNTYISRRDSFAAKAAPETLKVFDANDVVIWGNVEKLGKGVDKWLDDQKADTIGMLELQAFNGKGDPFNQALEKQVLNLGFNFIKEYFTDSNASMITLRLTDSGATLGIVGDFKKESDFGKFIASQAGRGPVSLKGLPGGNFLMAGTLRWNSASISDLLGKIADQILGDPAISKNAKAAEMKKGFDAARQMAGIMQGMSMVLLEPPVGAKDAGFLNGAALVETSDPKKFIELQLESAKNPIAQTAINPDIKTTVTLGAPITVKDVELTRMLMKFGLRDETPDNPIAPENRVAADAITRMYGKDGLTVSFGIVGKRVLVIYGTDNAMIESAISAAQSDGDVLSAGAAVSSVKDDVVANPVGVFYMPLARWVLIGPSLVMPGMPTGAATPAITNAPPMVMSAGVSGQLLTAEVHVPVAAITAVQAAIEQIEKAQNGPAADPNRP